MLVLSRFIGQRICIGRDIVVTINDIDGLRVSVGIEAPREIEVDREEVREDKDSVGCRVLAERLRNPRRKQRRRLG